MGRRAPFVPMTKRGGVSYIKGTNVRADSKRGLAMAKAYCRVVSAERKRQQGRAPGSRWRVQDNGVIRWKVNARKRSERFDEIAVDSWLHVEGMDGRSFYGTIAGISLWWWIKPNGDVEITHVELNGASFLDGALSFVAPELRKLIDGKAGQP